MNNLHSTISPVYRKILAKFPQILSFGFAYGSGVKRQLSNPNQNGKSNMIDLILCVDNSAKWHEENLKINKEHYSFLKHFGHNFVAKFQENSGAKVYFNTLVNIDDVLIKYGVVSCKDLVTDLLEWSDLYIAGRLHKPVEILKSPTNAELQTSLQLNLKSATHAALLILPDTFSEYEFYYVVSNLSYGGDFRMTFGENKNKVANIVKPQLLGFRNLYTPIIKSLHDYVDFPVLKHEEKVNKIEKLQVSPNVTTGIKTDVIQEDSEVILRCTQDICPLAKLHHLNQLPRYPQKALTRFWNQGGAKQDTEDVLRALAYDPECGAIVEQCINDIVWKSSVRQSLKGILTAGALKSVKYSSQKIFKMLKK